MRGGLKSARRAWAAKGVFGVVEVQAKAPPILALTRTARELPRICNARRLTFSSGKSGKASSAAAEEERGGEEVLPGAFKSPITKALWEIRRAEMKFQETRREAGDKSPSEDLRAVPPSLSRSAIHYPFSTDSFLREDYRNPSGLVRIGRVLEDLDALAGNIAFKHCSEDPSFPLLVTASVDRIVLKRHPRLDVDMTLMGRVVWTGRSSMVINMRCSSSAPGACYVGGDLSADDDNCWLDANFTFVARDRETGRSRAVSPLDLGKKLLDGTSGDDAGDTRDLDTDAENGWRAIWRVVQTHKDRQTLERKVAKEGAAHEKFSELEAARAKREEEAAKLVAAGFPLLHLPALANPHAVLVKQTAVSSTLICMPQHRNTANRIFGGFLMHRAYEVAFCAAFMFGGSRPRFSEIDEVVFLQPVDVGDLVHLEACVLYTKPGKDVHAPPEACVEVLASVVRPEAVESKVSNRFNLTFSFPELKAGNSASVDEKCSAVLRTVLPADATEASRIVMAKHKDRFQDAADEAARS